jgi:hypothetical protein
MRGSRLVYTTLACNLLWAFGIKLSFFFFCFLGGLRILAKRLFLSHSLGHGLCISSLSMTSFLLFSTLSSIINENKERFIHCLTPSLPLFWVWQDPTLITPATNGKFLDDNRIHTVLTT